MNSEPWFQAMPLGIEGSPSTITCMWPGRVCLPGVGGGKGQGGVQGDGGIPAALSHLHIVGLAAPRLIDHGVDLQQGQA